MRRMPLALGLLAWLALVLAGCGAATAKMVAHDGGLRITLSLACPSDHASCDVSAGRDAASHILATRLSAGLGMTNATVQASGTDGIVIELPGAVDHTAIVPALTKPGYLAVLDSPQDQISAGLDISARTCTTTCQPGQYRVLFTEAQLDRKVVAADLDTQTHQPVVTFGFAGDARNQFADYTASHIGDYLTLAIDGMVVESAVIAGRIEGAAEISGFPLLGPAVGIAAELKAGPLPMVVTIVSEQQVAPAATATA